MKNMDFLVPFKRVSQLTLCWVGFNNSAPVPELGYARGADEGGKLESRSLAPELSLSG